MSHGGHGVTLGKARHLALLCTALSMSAVLGGLSGLPPSAVSLLLAAVVQLGCGNPHVRSPPGPIPLTPVLRKCCTLQILQAKGTDKGN